MVIKLVWNVAGMKFVKREWETLSNMGSRLFVKATLNKSKSLEIFMFLCGIIYRA